jgi:hypothetical protein
VKKSSTALIVIALASVGLVVLVVAALVLLALVISVEESGPPPPSPPLPSADEPPFVAPIAPTMDPLNQTQMLEPITPMNEPDPGPEPPPGTPRRTGIRACDDYAEAACRSGDRRDCAAANERIGVVRENQRNNMPVADLEGDCRKWMREIGLLQDGAGNPVVTMFEGQTME